VQVYNVRKLHFQANLCGVLAEDKKQHHCGDLVLGWAVLLCTKSRKIMILYRGAGTGLHAGGTASLAFKR